MTVIEIFIPRGFAYDYEWTTRAVGGKHFGFWNDTYVPFILIWRAFVKH